MTNIIKRSLKSNTSDNGIYTVEETIEDTEEFIFLMPNRRIDSIGWQFDGVTADFYGTFSTQASIDASNAIWDQLQANLEVNTAITAIKIVGNGTANILISVRTIGA